MIPQKEKTLESKASRKNGIKRMTFVGISLLIELLFVTLFFTGLGFYSGIADFITRVLGCILALIIFSKDSPSSLKDPWILTIAILPVVGLTIFLLVGFSGSKKRMTKKFNEIDEKLLPLLTNSPCHFSEEQKECPEAANISTYIYKNSGYPVCYGTKTTYDSDAKISFMKQLEDLKKAEHFIFLEYHAIEDAESWAMVQKILEEKVKNGVDVRVIYDDVGSIAFVSNDFSNKLNRLGIKCKVFNPVRKRFKLFMNNRDHRKVSVIDGKYGYVGGYNIANEYFGFSHPYGLWKDAALRLEGNAVRSLIITFFEMWNAIGSDPYEDCSPFLSAVSSSENSAGFVQPYADSPTDSKLIGEDVYFSILAKANRYCYFMTPYFIISNEMSHAMSLAARRGVDVRIITPGIPDKKIIYSVTRSFYHDVVKDGVRVYEWTPGFLHAKVSLCDDVMATVGTINLDNRSMIHHFENGCFLTDCTSVSDIRDDFSKTFKESREVTSLYLPEPTRMQKIKKTIYRIFAGLL